MANIQYYDVILKPVVTEKSMELMADKKYTFLVHTEATKSQIKEAVEKMFNGTKVKSVNTMNLDGKSKRRGMTFGKTAKTKKAVVALTEDSAVSSGTPAISNITRPGLTTAAQYSTVPFPLPIRVSAGFAVIGLSGKILIQTLPPRLM